MRTKKSLFIISFLVLILLVVFFSFISGIKKEKPGITPLPTPTVFPIPSIPLTPLPINPTQETTAQQNYAKDRAQTLENKPWLLRLPIVTSDYFISYDTAADEFLVTIYYSNTGSVSKEQQLATDKEEALAVIQSLGVSLSDIKVTYFETNRAVTPAP